MKRKLTFSIAVFLGLVMLSALPAAISHAQSIDAAEMISVTCDGFTIGTRSDLGTILFRFEIQSTNPLGPVVIVSGSFPQTMDLQTTFFPWGDFPNTYVLSDGTLAPGDYVIVNSPQDDPGRTATLSGFNTIPLHYSAGPIFCEDEGEGCTPGYWKNHVEDWPPTGYSPGDDFDTTFGVDLFDPDITLEEAVNAKGGGDKRLARHGTAALLSAAHPDVAYPLTVAEVIAAVQAGDASTLAEFNELGGEFCPN